MSKGVLGKKLGMTGVFSSQGKLIPVTVVKAGPCIVTQIKSQKTDGYNALQLGFAAGKKRVNRPLEGHLKKSGGQAVSFFREFQVENPDDFKLGQTLSLDIFKVGDRVNVSGVTKGRGFSGVIKRHGFHGGKKTHGSHSHRIPGSIGCSAWPARVMKGKKMPGQYGNTRKTVKNIEIVDLRPDDHLILLKGAIPGSSLGVIEINKSK